GSSEISTFTPPSTPSSACARNVSTAVSAAAGSAATGRGAPFSGAPPRTTQHTEPPFWKNPKTECARYAPSMNGPLSGSLGSPKIFANCVQVEIRIGVLTGPPGARPTNAAIDVPTPSIGFEVEGTSSTYTPGVREVGISPLHSVQMTSLQRAAQSLRGGSEPPPGVGGAGRDDLHQFLVSRPVDDRRL